MPISQEKWKESTHLKIWKQSTPARRQESTPAIMEEKYNTEATTSNVFAEIQRRVATSN